MMIFCTGSEGRVCEEKKNDDDPCFAYYLKRKVDVGSSLHNPAARPKTNALRLKNIEMITQSAIFYCTR